MEWVQEKYFKMFHLQLQQAAMLHCMFTLHTFVSALGIILIFLCHIEQPVNSLSGNTYHGLRISKLNSVRHARKK